MNEMFSRFWKLPTCLPEVLINFVAPKWVAIFY